MALQHKLGRDLSSGTLKGVQTGGARTNADTSTIVITVEGPYSALESIQPAQGATNSDLAYIPSGCYVSSARLSSDGRGGGTLTITCVDPGEDSQDLGPTKITYRLTMAEEQTDLIAHPTITASASVLKTCIKWLATDDKMKYDADSGGYQYDEGDGATFTPITDETAVKFCAAWTHGIKTYNRYFPVVEKISTWKRVPGLTMNGASITGGSVASANFGDNVGKWNVPSITLSGFASTGWFKTKYDWTQNAKSSWTLTEQWVWSPDGSASAYGWIYQASSNS